MVKGAAIHMLAVAWLTFIPYANAEDSASTTRTVIVTGPTLRTTVKRIEQIAKADAKGRLARWYDPVCPLTVGLPHDFNVFIDRRKRTVARKVGAPTAGERCQSNILVLVTPHPDRLSEALLRRRSSEIAGGRWPSDKASSSASKPRQRRCVGSA